MKTKIFIGFCLAILSILHSIPTYSQVTIGSDQQPIQAAVLDVKNKMPGADNVSSEDGGGVLLPRVILEKLNTIAPLISTTLADDDTQKLLHTGLIVYNLKEDAGELLTKGIYCWTGKKWQLLLAREITPTGPWNKVTTIDRSKLNTDDSYINAKAVIGGASIAKINGVEDAVLTVVGDSYINGYTLGQGNGNVDAINNTAVGDAALQTNVTGKNNTAIGSYALEGSEDGDSNIAIGIRSLSKLTTGKNNIAIGGYAGSNITTGNNNILIGSGTEVPVATADGQINIGNALFGNISSKSVGIGVTKPKAALHVGGSITLTNAPEVAGNVLVVNSEGEIRVSETTPLQYAYIQSSETNSFASQKTNLNNSVDIVVPWQSDDISSNSGIVEFVSASNAFIIKRSFAAEISGYINYASAANYPSSGDFTANKFYDRDIGSSLLNLKIQISKDNGVNWVDLSNTRGIWTFSELGNQAKTVETPNVIEDLHEGNLIRMVIQRPTSGSGASLRYLGLPHGDNGAAAITLPPNMKYSKGIRIVGL